MGETSTFMKRHVAGLKPDQLFTTRDCLPFGSRAAVDQALSRLVKLEVLVRLARGVFTLRTANQAKPSLQEVANIKANAFGRCIATHGSTIAGELGLQAQANEKAVFSTNSSSSTFKYGNITVYFKKTCWRKMSLQKSKVGKAIVALWHRDKHQLDIAQIDKVAAEFGQVEKMHFRESAPWIPAWLSTHFLKFRFNFFRRQLVIV